MSLDWRYVLHPDGSFTRVMNLGGHFDQMSDDEIAALQAKVPPIEVPPLPPCSRCGGALVLGWHGPIISGVWMELCPACDGHKSAACAFIRWHRDPDRTVVDLPWLFEAWETETMREHGWARAEPPELPDNVTPLRDIPPRGRG